MNSRLLKAKMTVFGDTQLSLANALGISGSRLNSKINETDGAQFTMSEMQTIVGRYHLTEADIKLIFFDHEGA